VELGLPDANIRTLCLNKDNVKNLPMQSQERKPKILLGHNDVATTMIYTRILQQGGQGVPRALDDLDINKGHGKQN